MLGDLLFQKTILVSDWLIPDNRGFSLVERVSFTVSEMSLHSVHERRGHLPQSITEVSTVAAGASAQECPAPLTLQRVPCSQVGTESSDLPIG